MQSFCGQPILHPIESILFRINIMSVCSLFRHWYFDQPPPTNPIHQNFIANNHARYSLFCLRHCCVNWFNSSVEIDLSMALPQIHRQTNRCLGVECMQAWWMHIFHGNGIALHFHPQMQTKQKMIYIYISSHGNGNEKRKYLPWQAKQQQTNANFALHWNATAETLGLNNRDNKKK